MKICENILNELAVDNRGSVHELLTSRYQEAISEKGFEANLAAEVLENFKKRESSYCGCESLESISVGGYKKFRDCDGPTWLNWKGKGYRTIFDNVLVIEIKKILFI